MTAQKHTRRLITLIFAGRNRMDMIRRELPRTFWRGLGRMTVPQGNCEGSPFRGALRCHRRCCPEKHHNLYSVRLTMLRFGMHGDGPDETQQLPSQRGHNLVLVLAANRERLIALV